MSISKVQATLNGQTYTLTYNSSTGAYEGTLTAPTKSSHSPSGGFYAMSVTAYDDAGNYATVNSSDATFGNNLKLVVKEKVAPKITIGNPTDGATLINNKPTISWTVADADSGINKDSIKLFIDGTEVEGTISASGTDASYTCSYIPTTALADGSHTFKYTVSDNDGNKAEKSISIKVDTVAPTLNVTSPENNTKTNVSTITVSGTTNDATSSPVVLTVNDSVVSVGIDGSFSTTVTLEQGENTITVIATDGAGQSTTVTRTVIYDSSAPTFKSITITPNPCDAGATFLISVKVEDE